MQGEVFIAVVLTVEAYCSSILIVTAVRCVGIIEALQNRRLHSQTLYIVQQNGTSSCSIKV